MRRISVALFTTASVLGLMATASAADLSRPVYKALPPPPPVFSWSGFYFGGHVGAGWSTTDAAINSFSATGPGGGDGGVFGIFASGFNVPVAQVQSNGFLGGVQGGYNWQLAPWAVIGVESQFSWTNMKGTAPCLVVLGCSTSHNWVTTLAGRFGVTYDRALFYVKGGVAWAQTTYSASLNLGPIINLTTSVSDTRTGAMFGTGIEYAFTQNWSAKIEYDYIDFGNRDYNFPLVVGPVALNFGTTIHEKMHIVKAGLNYRFDWASPIVARY